MRNQETSRVARLQRPGGSAAIALLTLALTSSTLAAAEPASVLSCHRAKLKEALHAVLEKGGKALFHSGLGPFKKKARDRASHFVVDLNLGKQLEPEDVAYVDELAEEVFDEFRVDSRRRVDTVAPELTSLEPNLRAYLATYPMCGRNQADSREKFEQDALVLALEMYKVKTSNLTARPFEGANRQYILDLTGDILKSRDPAPPAPVPADNHPDPPPVDNADKPSAFTGQMRVDLIGVLSEMDKAIRSSRRNNVEADTDDKRIELLKDAVAAPNSTFLKKLKKMSAFKPLRSVTELPAVDRTDLNEKMIPEAVRANSAAPAPPPVPAPNGGDTSMVNSDPGASVGDDSYVGPGVPISGTSVYDEVLVLDGSSLSPGCRLTRGPRRATRGTVLLRSPYRGRSARSTTYYLVD